MTGNNPLRNAEAPPVSNPPPPPATLELELHHSGPEPLLPKSTSGRLTSPSGGTTKTSVSIKSPSTISSSGLPKQTKKQQMQQVKPAWSWSQLCEGDCGVYVTILAITLLAILVIIVKIVIIDIRYYPHLFGGADPAEGPRVQEEEQQLV